MKTLLRLLKRSLIFRLCYRLVCWINYPTSRERMWGMFEMGKVQGRKEALKELPIVQVQPRQTAKAMELHLPPGQWTRQWRETHPDYRAPIPQPQPTYWPSTLQDDSWLNSKPVIRTERKDETEGEPTLEVPAIMKLLYQERQARRVG